MCLVQILVNGDTAMDRVRGWLRLHLFQESVAHRELLWSSGHVHQLDIIADEMPHVCGSRGGMLRAARAASSSLILMACASPLILVYAIIVLLMSSIVSDVVRLHFIASFMSASVIMLASIGNSSSSVRRATCSGVMGQYYGSGDASFTIRHTSFMLKPALHLESLLSI